MDESAGRRPSIGKRTWNILVGTALMARFLIVGLIDWIVETIVIAFREKDLFVGTALLLVGVFSFETGRFCDGNTGDYLSCTRPAVYYFYDSFDIACIVLGAALVLAWFVKERMKSRS